MAVNLIVAAVTALMGVFVLVWVCCPWLRPWFEEPKYRFLGQQGPASRQEKPQNEEA